jgi:hypothetical protein
LELLTLRSLKLYLMLIGFDKKKCTSKTSMAILGFCCNIYSNFHWVVLRFNICCGDEDERETTIFQLEIESILSWELYIQIMNHLIF